MDKHSHYKTIDKTDWFIRKMTSRPFSRPEIIELAQTEFPDISAKVLKGTIGQYWSDSVNPKWSISKTIRARGLGVLEVDRRRHIVKDSEALPLLTAKEKIPSHTVPARERPSSEHYHAMKMSDPLGGFHWQSLYKRYDALCSRFNPRSGHLATVHPTPAKDRLLYYHLVRAASADVSGRRPALDLEWYEALLYWKLYSQPYVRNISEWLPKDKASRLRNAAQFKNLLAKMPRTIPRQFSAVASLLQIIDRYPLDGMKTETALPVRSTFLHFLYPTVVPIFDKMVLQAVGVTRKGSNQRVSVFRKYLRHASTLAGQHAGQLTGFKETPVRLTDMALWIIRNSPSLTVSAPSSTP